MTAANMLRAIETELSGHAVFGDARRILDRFRAVTLLRLDAAARTSLPAQSALQGLRDGRHRRTADDVLADPVVSIGIDSLLAAVRRGDESQVAEGEELCAAVTRRVRDGHRGLPTAAGCPLHVHPRGASPTIVLWDPDAPASIFKRRFESTFDDHLPGYGIKVTDASPEPAFADVVERGCDLLALVLPELAASVLAHLRLIVIIDGEDDSFTHTAIASTIFVASRSFRTPWHMAEALLHEALHCKLGALDTVSLILPTDGGDSPTIQVFWRRNQGGEGVGGAVWSLSRAFGAFHVYVHLALFFARVEHLGDAVHDAFGAMPASFSGRFRTALERADHLRRELSAVGPPLDSDGRSMFAWLSQALQRLSAAA